MRIYKIFEQNKVMLERLEGGIFKDNDLKECGDVMLQMSLRKWLKQRVSGGQVYSQDPVTRQQYQVDRK